MREASCMGDAKGFCTCDLTERRYCARTTKREAPSLQGVPGVEESQRSSNHKSLSGKWLATVCRKVMCQQCFRFFVGPAMRTNCRGERVCPSCLGK